MKLNKQQWRLFSILCALIVIFCCATTALADDSPLDAMNNLSTFLFGLIKSIGLIILAFGIVQVGLSLKSHDPSQRANVRPDRVLFQ